MIKVSGKFSKSGILSLLEAKVDEICSGEIHEVNKMKVNLRRFNPLDLDIVDNNIHLHLPLQFKLLKGEGIFAVEVTGKMEMSVEVNYTIDPQMHIDFNTKMIERKWLEGPIIEIGSLDLPVEKVADLVIDYHKNEILDNVNDALQSNINRLKYSLLEVKKIQDLINPYLPEGLFVDISRIEVIAQPPFLSEDFLQLNLLINPNLHVSTNFKEPEHHYPQLNFQWVEKIQEQTLGYLRGEISYDFILKILKNLINGMELGDKKIAVTQLSHQIFNDFILLKGQLLSPLEGKLSFKLTPVYNESRGELTLKNFESDIEPKSFIYRMGAPVLNKIIEEKIQNIFPWSVNKLLADKASKANGHTKKLESLMFTTSVRVLSVDELIFGREYASVKMRYEDLRIDINETPKLS